MAPAERSRVGEHLVERVDAAQKRVGRARRAIDRDAQAVESGLDDPVAAALGQRDRVGVEDGLQAAIGEPADHARELAVEQRLADPVQHDPLEAGALLDDVAQLVDAQVALGLVGSERQRAGLAQRVAAIRDLEVELADRFDRWYLLDAARERARCASRIGMVRPLAISDACHHGDRDAPVGGCARDASRARPAQTLRNW